MTRTETKIFDPADGFGALAVVEVSDPTVAKRGNRWWMYGASEVAGRPGIQLVSASLPDSNQSGYLSHGYIESANGRTGWTARRMFIPPARRVFDFCVVPGPAGYEAVFSRVWVGQGSPPAETGLWWSSAADPSSDVDHWSAPVQIMSAEDRGWHAGPWKPCLRFSETAPNGLLVFFSGTYSRNDGSPFPFVFTTGCLELDRPRREQRNSEFGTRREK